MNSLHHRMEAHLGRERNQCQKVFTTLHTFKLRYNDLARDPRLSEIGPLRTRRGTYLIRVQPYMSHNRRNWIATTSRRTIDLRSRPTAQRSLFGDTASPTLEDGRASAWHWSQRTSTYQTKITTTASWNGTTRLLMSME